MDHIEEAALDSDGLGSVDSAASAAVATEAGELQRRADERGLLLRLIGSLAIASRSPGHRHLLVDLGRRPPRDIDFVAYARDAKKIAPLFTERGYVLHPSVSHSREWGVKRMIWTHPEHSYKVDVFLDELVMAHTIGFAGRLEAEPHTVSLADLLLSKLQIHRITQNDLIDLVVLLAEKDLGSPPDAIDQRRLEVVLGADWGFWYGALQNLDMLDEALGRFEQLPRGVHETVATRTAALRTVISDAPKTTRWRLRARLGTRTPWYEDVEDIEI